LGKGVATRDYNMRLGHCAGRGADCGRCLKILVSGFVFLDKAAHRDYNMGLALQ
jgi:hypothetical protein